MRSYPRITWPLVSEIGVMTIDRLCEHTGVHLGPCYAHASWLLAGGADLQVVKDRLGHDSIRATERYLHTLPNADEMSLDALQHTQPPHASCWLTNPTPSNVPRA